MFNIKVISYNVRGLNNKIKQKRFISQVHRLKPDILLLQESHIKTTSNKLLKDKMFPYQLHSRGSSKVRGVAILINNSLLYTELATLKDAEGRLAITKGILNGVKTTIASLYAPNEGQTAHLEEAF